MYASAHFIDISINQKLICTIEFQAILVYLNPPNGVLESIVEKKGQSSSFFKLFVIDTCPTNSCLPELCYTLQSDIFLLTLTISWGYKTQ